MAISQASNFNNYVKALTIGELVKYVFQIYREQFLVLIFINGAVTLTTFLAFLPAFQSIGAVLGLLTSILNAVNIIVCSRAILKKPIRLKELYSTVYNSPYRGTIVLFTLFLLPIFFLILIYPDNIFVNAVSTGLILFFSIFFSSIVLIEKKGFRKGVKKFFRLLFSNFWNIASKFLVGFLIYVIISGILNLLFGTVLGDFSWILSDTIAAPIINLVGVFLYYDSRVRTENFNEELLAQEMGYQASTEMMSV